MGAALGEQRIRGARHVIDGDALDRACGRVSIGKMGIVEEEADETLYWLELLVAAEKITPKKVEAMIKEANEILAITVATIKTARQPKRATA